jgi:hypothetical protein
MNIQKSDVPLRDVYQKMTVEARQQAIRDIRALLDVRGLRGSTDYLEQVLLGLRKYPCSEEMAKIISGYFRGQIGIDVSPADVMGKPVEANG